MLVLDVPYIFRVVGGPIGLLGLLEASYPGTKLNYATVQMWGQRAAIPGAWVAPVLCALSGQGFALGQLVVDDSDPFGPPPERHVLAAA